MPATRAAVVDSAVVVLAFVTDAACVANGGMLGEQLTRSCRVLVGLCRQHSSKHVQHHAVVLVRAEERQHTRLFLLDHSALCPTVCRQTVGYMQAW